MRRKVLQDFTNVFCQRLIDLPNGCDLAVFAQHGSGKYTANILSGDCTFNGQPIGALQTCEEYKRWLLRQLEKHHVAAEGVQAATLDIEVTVGKLKKCAAGGHAMNEAAFSFACRSEIRTDERSYQGSASGEKIWRFEAGNARPIAPPNDDVAPAPAPAARANGNGAHEKEKGEQDRSPSGILSRFWQKISSPPRSSVAYPAGRGERPSG